MSVSNPGAEQARVWHLARVRALMAEMEAAIAAFERNNLPGLQSALANQEVICHELQILQRGTVPDSGAAPEITRQLHAAYVQLAQLNRVYAGVVKRGKRWVDLLCLLYGLHEEGYGQFPNPPADHQTLSCEV